MSGSGSENEDEQVIITKFTGVCPLGCMEKGSNKARILGKSYERIDGARKFVFNHLAWSPKHEDQSFHHSPDGVKQYMAENEDLWCIQEDQTWTQRQFDEWKQEHSAPVPQEPAGPPPGKAAAPGKGQKGKSQKGKGKGAAADLEATLKSQIDSQTRNMMHFVKAASTCISALKLASTISQEAMQCFDRERQNMEEGCEQMISAFGLAPESWSPGARPMLQFPDESYRLAQAVSSGSGLQRQRDRSRSRSSQGSRSEPNVGAHSTFPSTFTQRQSMYMDYF